MDFGFYAKKTKSWNIQISRSQSIFIERTSEKVRWNLQDLYFSKIKQFNTLPQFPLVSGTIEEAFLSKFFKTSYFWDLILPQPYHKQKIIEAGWKTFFSKNIGIGGSNAFFPKSFRQIFAEIDASKDSPHTTSPTLAPYFLCCLTLIFL